MDEEAVIDWARKTSGAAGGIDESAIEAASSTDSRGRLSHIATDSRGRLSHIGRRGFTLFELVLILAIIAVTVGVAIPALGGFAQSRELSDVAVHFLATARMARSSAISEGVVYRIKIEAAKGQWSLMKADETGVNFITADSSGESDYALPSKMQISCDSAEVDGEQNIEFQPTGQCDVAVVTLTGLRGAERKIACDGPFEKYHIVKPGGGR